MTDADRRFYIRTLARKQIIEAIRQDMDGDESLMKEVWEECDSEEEHAEALDMMAKIIVAIEGLDEPVPS